MDIHYILVVVVDSKPFVVVAAVPEVVVVENLHITVINTNQTQHLS